jgi:hydroxymethylpyrimidine pyrophosphatase-like HAD family hydrolase
MALATELAAVARELRGIFCDIDDTLTHEGALVPDAYAQLVAARAAGLRVVPVTGRPAGWGAVLAATWPVDAVVAENGAVAVERRVVDGRVSTRWSWWDGEDARAAAGARLAAIRDDVLAHEPRARLAEDQWLRRCDVAFDIGETQTLASDEVAAIVARIEGAGARAITSTVHAHAFFGDYDKARMLVRLAGALWGEDLDGADRARYLFVGDSPNDQAAFAHFPISAGVGNVRRFLDRLNPAPRYLATADGGHGFAEIVDIVLRNR